MLLNCLTKEDDPIITEWRGYGKTLEKNLSRINSTKKINQLIPLFDWHEYFYKFIYTTTIGDQNKEQMLTE